ncbi:MAG: hypothetical protein L0Y73_09330 [Candidatus Aminicenantes bacterium]|nr:hypothetical protein [Candidatus Aminicenantes bacterium]
MVKDDLKSIFWDYELDYTSEDIYNFLVGKLEIKDLRRSQVIARLLATVRWYDLIDIFGVEQVYDFLTDEALQFVWRESLKTRYKNVREVLQGIL